MPEHEIKPGDIVRVRSGSPEMTVSQVGKRAMTGEESVWCVWFDGPMKFEDTFPIGAVEKV